MVDHDLTNSRLYAQLTPFTVDPDGVFTPAGLPNDVAEAVRLILQYDGDNERKIQLGIDLVLAARVMLETSDRGDENVQHPRELLFSLLREVAELKEKPDLTNDEWRTVAHRMFQYESAVGLVADEINVSAKTVKRYTDNPKPQNRGVRAQESG